MLTEFYSVLQKSHVDLGDVEHVQDIYFIVATFW